MSLLKNSFLKSVDDIFTPHQMTFLVECNKSNPNFHPYHSLENLTIRSLIEGSRLYAANRDIKSVYDDNFTNMVRQRINKTNIHDILELFPEHYSKLRKYFPPDVSFSDICSHGCAYTILKSMIPVEDHVTLRVFVNKTYSLFSY